MYLLKISSIKRENYWKNKRFTGVLIESPADTKQRNKKGRECGDVKSNIPIIFPWKF